MKHFFYLCTLLLLLGGCQDDDTPAPAPEPEQILVGRWHWQGFLYYDYDSLGRELGQSAYYAGPERGRYLVVTDTSMQSFLGTTPINAPRRYARFDNLLLFPTGGGTTRITKLTSTELSIQELHPTPNGGRTAYQGEEQRYLRQ